MSGMNGRAQLVYMDIFLFFFQIFSVFDLSMGDGGCLNLDSEY